MSPTSIATWLKPTARAFLASAMGLSSSHLTPMWCRSCLPAIAAQRRWASNLTVTREGKLYRRPWTDPRPYPDLVRAHAICAERSPARALTRSSQSPNCPCSPIGRGAAVRSRRLLGYRTLLDRGHFEAVPHVANDAQSGGRTGWLCRRKRPVELIFFGAHSR